MTTTVATGALGENIARQFLERKGYEVLARNFRKPYGEIDIVAVYADVVHFVEVKAVTREPSDPISRVTDHHRPEEMAHEAKLRKVARTAEVFMAQTNDKRDYQVDVIGVLLDPVNRKAICRHFEQVL